MDFIELPTDGTVTLVGGFFIAADNVLQMVKLYLYIRVTMVYGI